MKMISCKWVLIVLLSVFVLSCKKDSDTPVASSGGSGSGSGSGSTSSATARYTQNATLEDYTGLNCGWCPGAHNYLVKAETAFGAKVIPMEIHGTSYESAGSPFIYAPADNLASTFSVTGFPTIRLNRTIDLDYGGDPTSDIKSYVTAATSSAISSTVGLAINSSLSGAVLSITVKSRFSNATSGSKLVVYVLENGVAGNQSSYFNTVSSSPYYQQGGTLTYLHDGVLRISATTLLGDAIQAQSAAAEYSKTYTVTVPAKWNSSNLSIAAMVVTSANELINAQQAKVGQVQDFQILAP